MFRINRSFVLRQVSGHSPVSWRKITDNLLGYPWGRITSVHTEICMSQKTSAPTNGSDKSPPSKTSAKTVLPDLNKKTENSANTDKKGFLFTLSKEDKQTTMKAIDLTDAKYVTNKLIPETEPTKSVQRASKSESLGKLNPQSAKVKVANWRSKKNYGVDFSRKTDTSQPYVTEDSSNKTQASMDPSKKPADTHEKDLRNGISTTQSSDKSCPSNWIPAKNVIDTSGYFEKSNSNNWTPSAKYCSCLSKTRISGEQDKSRAITPVIEEPPSPIPAVFCGQVKGNGVSTAQYGVNSPNNSPDNWTPTTQYCSCSAKTVSSGGQNYPPSACTSLPQYGAASFQSPAQGNWIPTPQYFATDFSQKSSDFRGNYDNQLPSNWTTQHRVDSNQPAGGAGGIPDSKKSDSHVQALEKKSAFKPPNIYDLRKYSLELPSNASKLEFEPLGNMPTGIFRNHAGECLGPAAQKGGFYQNPEYFAFHNLTYYDMHLLLRDFRSPSPDTKRKL